MGVRSVILETPLSGSGTQPYETSIPNQGVQTSRTSRTCVSVRSSTSSRSSSSDDLSANTPVLAKVPSGALASPCSPRRGDSNCSYVRSGNRKHFRIATWISNSILRRAVACAACMRIAEASA